MHLIGWLFDWMSVVRTVKSPEAYKEFFQKILNFIESRSKSDAVKVAIMNDWYLVVSIKEGTRWIRSEDGGKICINGVD